MCVVVPDARSQHVRTKLLETICLYGAIMFTDTLWPGYNIMHYCLYQQIGVHFNFLFSLESVLSKLNFTRNNVIAQCDVYHNPITEIE